MATSIQPKTFSPLPARARVARSVCALALAATAVIGIGINADTRSSRGTAPIQPHVTRAASTAPVASALTYAYLVDTRIDADTLLAASAQEQNVRIVAADSIEGRALINSMAASWGPDGNGGVIDLRR